MVYLLGSTIGALRLGRAPSVLLAVLNMLAFDYMFVPPTFSLEVEDTRYLFALAVMLVVSLVIANLMVSIRRHREIALAGERRTAVLYAMSRELAIATDARTMVNAAVRHVGGTFQGEVDVLLADDEGQLLPVAGGLSLPLQPHLPFAATVVASGERAVRGAIYLPLRDIHRVQGVMVVCPAPGLPAPSADMLNLLDAFAAQLALSLQRVSLAETAAAARVAAERAALRNTLLASISHDLRTPLAAIAGAGSLLAQPDYALNVDRRTTLGALIERKAGDMTALLANVLELTRMEAGDTVRTDWHAVDELISIAIRHNEARLSRWRLVVQPTGDLPLVRVDGTLVLQMLNNLLENASKYTPAGTTVTIAASLHGDQLQISVGDDGPGLPAGDPDMLFEKFHRSHAESGVVGAGLGLAICRAAARLHGGDIRALPNAGGGARFEIRLPVSTQAVGAATMETT